MLLGLAKLIFVRGVGVAIYTVSAIYALPETNIVTSILVLSIIDFLAGMLYPTFKTAVVSGRVDIEFVFGISLLISFFLLVGSYFIYPSTLPISFIFYCVIVVIFPSIVKAGSLYELKDVDGHIKLEAFTSFIAAISASIFLIFFKLLNLDSDLSTPALRVFLYFIVCYIFYVKRGFLDDNIKPRLSFNIKLLTPLVGIEYLMSLSVLRAKILYLISNNNNFDGSVKIISLLYDPISAFYGYFLRSTFSTAKYNDINYLILVMPIFFCTLATSFIFATSIFIFDELRIGLIISVVSLLLALAGLTTNYIISQKYARLSYMIIYMLGLILFEFNHLIIGLIGVSLSLMFVIFMQRKGRI
jgi:hypothetical protein